MARGADCEMLVQPRLIFLAELPGDRNGTELHELVMRVLAKRAFFIPIGVSVQVRGTPTVPFANILRRSLSRPR